MSIKNHKNWLYTCAKWIFLYSEYGKNKNYLDLVKNFAILNLGRALYGMEKEFWDNFK